MITSKQRSQHTFSIQHLPPLLLILLSNSLIVHCLTATARSNQMKLSPLQPTYYRAILFDIDGTLANSWKLGFDATQIILQNHNIPLITEHEYHRCTRFSTPDRLARHVGLDPQLHEDEFWKVGNRLGKEFDDLYVNLVSTQTAGLFPGVKELVESIPKDVKVGVLTNACVAYANAVLEVNFDDCHRFVSVKGADNVPAPKPEGDGLLVCCKEMGVLPEECVYIGDSPSDGVAAQAAGMPSIGVLWGSHSMESLSSAPFQHICSTIDELKRLISQRVS